ncbi:hypothetical protein D9756_003532 [Leucocoprinus leucothites]|uniref:MARVEL domain-containing protein n=1 Tax=Leucocoprinus leucothites TaxID=201217 RepID=A0A8H5G670_9AGAR|nr:hypothetical protein D9756_003532 [Leucoagaricus leucothites]
MQDKLFHTRNAAFAIYLILSLAALGISAHWASLTTPEGLFLDFEGIGIVASALSIIVLSTFLFVGAFRKNAALTIIAVELPALIVLSVLFLAEGAILNDRIKVEAPFGCNDPFRFSPFGMKICQELVSLRGLSFSIFALMIIYWLPLLVMTIIELTQGRNVFTLSVREVEFSLHSQTHAQAITNGVMQEMGPKDPNGDLDHQHYDLAQQQQQQQIQLQQLQLQQLQQQQAMLQQQNMQQGRQEV